MYSVFSEVASAAAMRINKTFGTVALLSLHGSNAVFDVDVTIRPQLLEVDFETRSQERVIVARFLRASYPDDVLAGGTLTIKGNGDQYRLAELFDETDQAITWIVKKI